MRRSITSKIACRFMRAGRGEMPSCEKCWRDALLRCRGSKVGLYLEEHMEAILYVIDELQEAKRCYVESLGWRR